MNSHLKLTKVPGTTVHKQVDKLSHIGFFTFDSGKIGKTMTVEEGYDAAKYCGLNLCATLKVLTFIAYP